MEILVVVLLSGPISPSLYVNMGSKNILEYKFCVHRKLADTSKNDCLCIYGPDTNLQFGTTSQQLHCSKNGQV